MSSESLEFLIFKRSIGVDMNHAITISEFLRAVGELKVRGTSQIYRAPTSILKYVREIM